MNVELIEGAELAMEEMARWEEIRLNNSSLSSPYFSPTFVQIASRIRDNVRVGVIHEGNEVVGFFPFESGRKGIGRPVGGCLSDYHGLIVDRPLPTPVSRIIQACGLSTWTFDHCLADQSCFAAHARVRSESPIIGLGSGFSGYEEERRRHGSKVLQRTASKKRKLEREMDRCRFVFSSVDPAALEFVIRLKSEQCLRTGTFDFFGIESYRSLVKLIHVQREGDFQGVLSTLSCGDDLVAAHFGMRSGSTLHWWFPVYDHQFARYRPGQVLLLELIREAQHQGIELVDLGKGDDHYKTRFMNGSVPLLEGKVYTRSPQAAAIKCVDGAESFLRKSRWMKPIRTVGRKLLRR